MAAWDVNVSTVLPVAVPALVYATGRVRLQHQGVHWPTRRDAAFTVGLLCIVAAIMSPIAAYDEQFPVHMVQHLLLGMVAPCGFALAAPITLLLRASPIPIRRQFVRILHTRLIRWLSWAPVGALLSAGLMWPLYLSPLYAATLHHPLVHDTVHAPKPRRKRPRPQHC